VEVGLEVEVGEGVVVEGIRGREGKSRAENGFQRRYLRSEEERLRR
jgi:hypothetical protein